jgi:magnesium-transporting ATPase (P-type)
MFVKGNDIEKLYKKLEASDPKKLERRLTWINIILALVLICVLVVLIIIVFQHFLLAIIDTGARSNSIIDIIKTFFATFFENFGDMTGMYMVVVTAMIMVNMVGIGVSTVTRRLFSNYIYFTILIGSIIVAFLIPAERFYFFLIRDGHKTPVLMLCTFLMICAPPVLSRIISTDRFRAGIMGKSIHIVIFSLLIAQILLEG